MLPRAPYCTVLAGLLLPLLGCSHDRSEQTLLVCPQPRCSSIPSEWNATTAAAYLDAREKWWASWSSAAREEGTFCVSCHTSVPYMLAQPALRRALGQQEISPSERKLLENVTKRVRLWNQIHPYYGDADEKSRESRATEAVLNALILANRDAEQRKLDGDTVVAFQNMWQLQISDGSNRGAWAWQQFHLRPWESHSSVYSGAAWAALAVGLAPEDYQNRKDIQGNLAHLRNYLTKNISGHSLLNQIYVLWAATRLKGLLNHDQQHDIIAEILQKQREDGGWSLSDLTWSWQDEEISSLFKSWLRDKEVDQNSSDGLATGLAVFVLTQARVTDDDARLRKGVEWLCVHQDKQRGIWLAHSLNKKRDTNSNVGLFMSDAATAFASLALSEVNGSTKIGRTAALN